MDILNIKDLTKLNTLNASDMILVARNSANDIGYTTYNTALETLSSCIVADSTPAGIDIATSWTGVTAATTDKALGANLGYGLKTSIDTINSNLTNNYLNKTTTAAQSISGQVTFSKSPNIPASTVTSANKDKTVNVSMLSTYVASNVPTSNGAFSSTAAPKIWRYVFDATWSTTASKIADNPLPLSSLTYNKYSSANRPTAQNQRIFSTSTNSRKSFAVQHLIHFFQKAGLVTVSTNDDALYVYILDDTKAKKWNLAKFNSGKLKEELQDYLKISSNGTSAPYGYPQFMGKITPYTPLTFSVAENTVIIISAGTPTTPTCSNSSTPYLPVIFPFGDSTTQGNGKYVAISQWLNTPVTGEIYG